MSNCKPSSLTIGEVVVNQDVHGRYSLNDLHRAAGLESRHRPAEFLRLSSTQELCEELMKEVQYGNHHTGPVEVINGGPDRGTYACKELVYAYAMWVSPSFHVKVIRVFNSVAQGEYTPVAPARALPTPTEEKVAGHSAVLNILKGIPGIRAGIAASVMLDAIHQDTGLTMEPYRKALPPGEGPASALNASAVGESLGISAQKANKRLESAGLQRRNERNEWELTEAGAKYGEAIPYTRGSHSGYQVLWKPEVIDFLKSMSSN